MKLNTAFLRVLAALTGPVAVASATATQPSAPSKKPPAPVMQVYKSPTCGCCKQWMDHARAAGFEVRATDLDEAALQVQKAKYGVADNLRSCHTAIVGGYAIEGHVPASDVWRLLKERPAVAGIAAPGMPRGSPGMEVPGGVKDPFDVVAFTKAGATRTFAKH
jgi:hypothetical protein